MTTARFSGSVRIVGAGLLGTSIGLALTKLGIDVSIESASPASQALAIDYGAGRAATDGDQPTLIVVCVPPDVTARLVIENLTKFPNAIVTDVASVKNSIVEALFSAGADLSRFVGSHPMAGRERGGAVSGRADLFVGRPWVITPSASNTADSIKLVEDLALDLGAVPAVMAAVQHDQAVALVSHVPQLISSLLAARLIDAESAEIALAGQGLRDTTRIAASDPSLWLQILTANATSVAEILRSFQSDLDKVIAALENPTQAGSLAVLNSALEAGNRGVERIPGKHGAKATQYAQIVAMIDDRPGQFAKLLTDIGEIGINLEDVKLEHSPGAQIGLVEVYVLPEFGAKLVTELVSRGWRIAG